jgi:hypothetical protein
VADVDDRHAVGAKLFNRLEELFDFVTRQCAGRLVR